MRRRTLLIAAAGLAAAACGRDVERGPGRTTDAPGSASSAPPVPPQPPGTPEPGGTDPARAVGREVVVLPVICREAWGARPAGDGLGRHAISGLMVHHDAVLLDDNREAPARLRSHQRFHQGEGWADIAYHVAVDRGGNAYELRTPQAPGDTFTDYDPRGWYQLVALGSFGRQRPSRAQLEGLARVLAAAGARYGVRPASVAAHREHAATTCPGDALAARLPEVGSRAAELSGRVRVRRLCGAAGRRRVAAVEAGRA